MLAASALVAQKMMEPELHHESTQPFGWRRRNAQLDVHKYFALGDGFFLACRCLHGLKRGEPLLKQFYELLICGLLVHSFPTFSGNIRGAQRSAVNYWLLGRSGYSNPFIASHSGSHPASANNRPLVARTDSGTS